MEKQNETNALKQLAAEFALKFVQSNMILGFGSGSTVRFFLEKLGEKVRSSALTNVRGIPSSLETEKLAVKFGIPLTKFSVDRQIDLNIDGADEVDAELDLIKGGGGALLREKILAQNSQQFFIIADESKLVQKLGLSFPLPIEVIPFALQPTVSFLKKLGFAPQVRKTRSGENYSTDQGNFIIDFFLREETSFKELEEKLSHRAGIVEHGLFLKMAQRAIIGGRSGVQIFRRNG